jgi:cytochrome c
LERLVRKCRKKRQLESVCLRASLLGVALVTVGSFAQSVTIASGAKSDSTTAPAKEIASGKDLFHQHCASCHFEESTAQKIGPGLKGLYARGFSNGTGVTDAGLTKWIVTGGKNMPGFKETFKPEQVRALLSYIKTL